MIYKIDNSDELFYVFNQLFNAQKSNQECETECEDYCECEDCDEYIDENYEDCECDECLVLDYATLILDANSCPHCIKELLEGFLDKIKEKYGIEE